MQTLKKKSEKKGCLTILFILVLSIANWFYTGYLVWNWTQPENFFGTMKFIITWSIIWYVTQIVGGLILAGMIAVWEVRIKEIVCKYSLHIFS